MTAADALANRNEYRHSGDGMLDLSALWRAVAAHKFWIIIPTLLVLVGAFVLVNLITPQYTGEARILLESRDGFYTRPAGDRDAGGDRIDSETVLSQVQVVMSRDLAREAIRRLKLVGNPEFDSGAGLFGSLQNLMVRLGLSRNPADRTPEDRVLEKYYDKLLVFPVARSRVMAIEFQSADAELAARAANTIAAVYLESLEGAKKDNARGASQWLGGAITPLRQRVQEAEAKVEEFRSRSGLLIGANNTTISQQQLADLSQQLSSARAIQSDSQAKARILREALRAGRIFDVPDVANNELVRRLVEQRVTLRAQIALESRSLLPEHPRIKELTAQITDLEGQIRAAAERAVRTLENEARIAGSRVETVAATIEAQKRTVTEANESEVQLRALEREAKTQRDQLEQFLGRQRDALARDADNATPADARVVSRAITPLSPSFPKKVPTVAVATLAAFMVSLATVISRELLSGRAVSPAPAPGLMPQPQPVAPGTARFSSVSRRAPTADGADDAVTVPDDEPVAVAADTAARDSRRARVAGLISHAGRLTHLHLMLDDAGNWAEQIASCIEPREESKGVRMLVLDAGTRAGGSRILGGELADDAPTLLIDLGAGERSRQPGMSELLSGDASFAEIIERDPQSRLHIITAGRAGREAVIAAADLLDMALDALSDAYAHVLVELSPRDLHRFQGPLMPLVDGGLVLADNVSNGHAVETAYRLTEGNEIPVAIGVFQDAAEPLSQPRQKAEA
ncbi:MAG: exopolysaccharide transport family protein [Hyphomicrobiales bacterium]|jgi:polysaccharide biosynthesis transport protein|nr:exopolysaccharide transport family protein [Hyphomicrobiales bacterium]